MTANNGLLADVNERIAELELRLGRTNTVLTESRDRIAALETTVKKLRADLRSRGPESKRMGGPKR